MCGICGIADRGGAEPPVTADALGRMTDSIRHRGPDEDGHFLAPGIALGMRRLSIIDLPGSHQPIFNEDRTVCAVFNGEIYNYRDLRSSLERAGHRLSTAGDTETIVHLYEEYDLDFVHHLRGMFAIAIWDAGRNRLVLARDRMGVKPLYVMNTADGIAFASEVKCLIAGEVLEPELDPVAADLFMTLGYVPGPATLFAGVEKLPPASLLVWTRDGGPPARSTYWTPWDPEEATRERSWTEDQEHLLAALRESVTARMVSDVPIGVMLSGGLDSSLIAALMAEQASGPLKTFAIGFAEDDDSNELADARSVARRLGTDHHELLTHSNEHEGLLQEVLWHQEEPIADLSGLGFLILSRLASEHVKVALSGQGADELLGGYRKHQIAAGASAVSRVPGLSGVFSRLGSTLSPNSSVARGLESISTDDAVSRFLTMSRIVQSAERSSLYGEALGSRGDREVTAVVEQHLGPHRDTPLSQILHLDTRLALVDNMLLYFDKLSMASSLEVRVPFLDHDLVRFCYSLPDNRRVRLMRRKELLKRASAGLVDEAIINKKKRGFFRAGLGAWMTAHRGALVHDVLLDPSSRERGLFEPAAVSRLLDMPSGADVKTDQRLFCMFLLELWNRFYVDADGPGALRPSPSSVA